MSEDEELNRGTSRKVKVEQSTREAMNISDSGFHHKVTIDSSKGCNLSSIQQIV